MQLLDTKLKLQIAGRVLFRNPDIIEQLEYPLTERNDDQEDSDEETIYDIDVNKQDKHSDSNSDVLVV